MKIIVAIFVLVGCGTEMNYRGSWRFAELSCDNEDVFIFGYSSVYDISTISAKRTINAKDCRVVIDDIPILRDGDVRLLEGAASGISCKPNPCTIWSNPSVDCPEDYPIAGNSLIIESATATTMITSFSSSCIATWVR